MKNRASLKIIFILLLLTSTLPIGIFISLSSLEKLRDDATAINNIGYIRGSIQRLAHASVTTEKEQIIYEIREKFEELENHFIVENKMYIHISDFESKFKKLQDCWAMIESSHLKSSSNDLCERSWQVADKTASSATQIVHKKYEEIVLTIFTVGSIVFALLLLAIFIIHFEVRNQLEVNILKDPLTKLYNRNYLLEQLKNRITSFNRLKQPFSLIFMDLDHFKYINDTHGHQTGDRVLKEFSSLLSPLLRSEDIAFRYGGEEFLILAKSANEAEAYLLAERIRKKVSAHDFNIEDSVTLSLGISEFTEFDTLDTILSHADSAMYQAKEQGRNQSCIYKD